MQGGLVSYQTPPSITRSLPACARCMAKDSSRSSALTDKVWFSASASRAVSFLSFPIQYDVFGHVLFLESEPSIDSAASLSS